VRASAPLPTYSPLHPHKISDRTAADSRDMHRYGQRGLGHLEDQFLPVHNTLLQEESEKYTEQHFPGLPPPKMIRIYVGNYHSVAISDDGKYVMTWGRGELGQLGHQYVHALRSQPLSATINATCADTARARACPQ
jgi:alpha-tubulin suppressor-like RCC1 family protein